VVDIFFKIGEYSLPISSGIHANSIPPPIDEPNLQQSWRALRSEYRRRFGDKDLEKSIPEHNSDLLWREFLGKDIPNNYNYNEVIDNV